MQNLNIFSMLLGAGLVTLGFLAAAFAERLRTPPRPEVQEPQEIATQQHLVPATLPRTPAVLRAPRSVRAEAKANQGNDVVEALIAVGHKRSIAMEATWACDAAERANVESWTAAALRRCAVPTSH